MKKILSIFALLLTIVIGAKAAKPSISGITLPDAPTTALDLSSQTDFTPDANGWIVFSPKAESVNNKAYWANNATNGNSRTWSKPSGAVAPFVGGSSKTVFALQTGRVHALTFTGAETFSVLGKSGGTGRYVHVALYTFDGTNFGLVDDKSDNSNSDKELLFEDLTSSTTYVAYFYGSDTSNSDLFEVALKAGATAEVTGVSLDGVKIDGSTATETTDYTISGTNITLTGSYSIAPEVSLIEKTTYDEGDPTTKDIAVTLTKGEAYFTGSAKIGDGTDYETEYTVQVPVSTAATLEASVASATVTSPKVVTGTSKFNVVGANLTGTTVDLAFASAVDGLTVSPASIEVTEGAVNQEVTISYYSTEDVAEANVNLTITSTGVDAITIPVTYSSTAGIADLTPISDSYTWDWSTAASANIASPDPNNVVVFANADGWNASFDAEAIAGKANSFYASKTAYKYCQGSILKFNTNYPGTVSIDFSNTGSKSEYRWLAVNGAVTEYKSKDETKVTTAEIAVPAGDVTIEAIMGTSAETAPEYTAANTMLNFRKVVFTADNGKEDSDLAVAAEASVNIGETEDVVYTTSSTGAISVETSNPAIATATLDATNKTITISGVAAGQATITVSQEADDNYNAGSKEIAVTVINPNVKYVYDVTGLSSDEIALTKDNIGGDYGTSENNQFVTVSSNNWNNGKTYAGYTGDFFNMSASGRYVTFKVKGAENFKVYAQNTNSGRDYTVKIGSGDAVTVNHGATGAEYSDLFETGTTDEVTITIAGDNGSIYPIAIKFNIPATENIAFSDVTTYVTQNALDFSEVTELSAYAVTQIKTTSVATEKVGQVPAGTPLLIKADGAVDVDVPVIDNAASITNLLLASDGNVTGDGETIFAYSKNGLKFKKVASNVTIPEDKAYLVITTPNAGDALDVDFEGEATGVNGVAEAKAEVAPVKVIKNGQLFIGNYNVAGARVK